MSDLSQALVPYIEPAQQQESSPVINTEVTEASLERQPVSQPARRQRRGRDRFHIPSGQRPFGLSFVFSCVTHQPFSIYLTNRGVVMDRNGFNPYNAPLNTYPSFNGGGHQGQGGYSQSQQQQQSFGGQNQYSGTGIGQGGEPSSLVNHYHGSSFNFVFVNSGAYDLNFRAPGLTNGGINSVPHIQQNPPQQPTHQMANPGVGYGNSSQSFGHGTNQMGRPHANSMQQPNLHNMNRHDSGFFRSSESSPYPQSSYGSGSTGQTSGLPHLNGQGFHYGDYGQENMPHHPLRRSNSVETVMSDECSQDAFVFSSQQSRKRF